MLALQATIRTKEELNVKDIYRGLRSAPAMCFPDEFRALGGRISKRPENVSGVSANIKNEDGPFYSCPWLKIRCEVLGTEDVFVHPEYF